MRKIFLIALVVFYFSGAIRLYASDIFSSMVPHPDVDKVVCLGDVTWFLTYEADIVTFNNKTHEWNRKSSSEMVPSGPPAVTFYFNMSYPKQDVYFFDSSLIDSEGFWCYRDGMIQKFGKDHKLKKEYYLFRNYKGNKTGNEIKGLCDDGKFIWIVFQNEKNHIYGIEKETGNKFDYTIRPRFARIFLWPLVWPLALIWRD